MVINEGKSSFYPSQFITHLGFDINFLEGRLCVPPHKLKTARKDLGKILVQSSLSCLKMAQILGSLRSFLIAMPWLRPFTDELNLFVNQHRKVGWHVPLPVPIALKEQIKNFKDIVQSWKGRPFLQTPRRELHSDSSSYGWGE